MGSGFLGPPTASAAGAAPFHKMSASMWGGNKGRKGENGTGIRGYSGGDAACLGCARSQDVTAGIAKLGDGDGVT